MRRRGAGRRISAHQRERMANWADFARMEAEWALCWCGAAEDIGEGEALKFTEEHLKQIWLYCNAVVRLVDDGIVVSVDEEDGAGEELEDPSVPGRTAR